MKVPMWFSCLAPCPNGLAQFVGGLDMAGGLEFERRAFARSAWGPLRLVAASWGNEVTVADGPTVTIDFSKVRKPSTPAEERLPSLRLGVPILIDGQPRAMATSAGEDRFGLVKPGRIRISGDDPDLVPPGLTLRGHVLPQRLTLECDAGRLVWSPWPLGYANLHTGPLLLGPPRVAAAARPEHIGLWLAAWCAFEGQI